jgi:hypothetical protein
MHLWFLKLTQSNNIRWRKFNLVTYCIIIIDRIKIITTYRVYETYKHIVNHTLMYISQWNLIKKLSVLITKY